MYVRGKISFIVDDPGRQSVGSFHPITEGSWYDVAYRKNEGFSVDEFELVDMEQLSAK